MHFVLDTGVKFVSLGEALSIPFQQTARYLKYYPNDVTSNEFKVIDKILNARTISKVYKPTIADPVKATFKRSSTSKDLYQYFIVWGKHFMRHPSVYIDAFVAKTSGYYYPFSWSVTRRGVHLYQSKHKALNPEKFDFYYVFPESLRKGLSLYIESFFKLPFFSALLSPGIYLWGLIIIIVNAGYFFFNQKKIVQSIMLGIPMMTFIFSILSPVSG